MIKMPGRKKAKERKVALPSSPSHCEERGGQNLVTPLLEKRPKTPGLGQSSNLKEISLTSSNTPLQRAAAGILYKGLKVPASINYFIQALQQQTATQVLKLSYEFRSETEQGKKQRLLACAEKKAGCEILKRNKRDTYRSGRRITYICIWYNSLL